MLLFLRALINIDPFVHCSPREMTDGTELTRQQTPQYLLTITGCLFIVEFILVLYCILLVYLLERTLFFFFL